MSKFSITPDIAELIGAYKEGATLSAEKSGRLDILIGSGK